MTSLSSLFKDYPGRLKRGSLVLFVLVFIVLLYGIAFIYGTGQQTGGSFAFMWKKQLVWIGIGSVFMVLISGADYRTLGKYAWLIYVGSMSLLIFVLIFGAKINGARSWIRIVPGVSIQPSEFSKIGLLVFLSWITSRPSVRFDRLRHLAPAAIVTAIPVLLILLQPDFGSAGVLLPIALGILFVSGIKKRWIAYGLAAALLATPIIYRYGLQPHQKKRIITFVNPSKNATDEGWNARQSLLAVGSGGMSGKGYMKGTQNVLGFLPQTVAPTDFIFSVIAEETGFVSSLFLIMVLSAILMMGIYIAARAPENFGRNLACGISILFCVHIYVNIGMTMGMAPIIGIPLPFVSYGGSFMIMVLICVGMLQSIYCQRNVY